MRILIDAMGGDNAPGEIVRGAVEASREFHVDVALVGREAEILACLNEMDVMPGEHIQIVNAPDVISMEDDPSTATRKKPESSMSVALQLLHRGEGDAVISAGSTGALLSGATLTVRRIRGIRRACFGPVIPNGGKGTLLIDCGANVECTAEYLLQFAYMGKFYTHDLLGCEDPRIGLLNIGAEETKGTELQKQTYALLKEAHEAGRLNFVGNVEARDVFSGNVDVLVCDGFSGNVFLKSSEGVALAVMKRIKQKMTEGLVAKAGALLSYNKLKEIKKEFDYSEEGGAPILGLKGPVLKIHGSSKANAVYNAILKAVPYVEQDVTALIENAITEKSSGEE